MSIEIARVERVEVDLVLASQLQGVALDGWQRSVPDRTVEELQIRFRPDDDDHLEEVVRTYRYAADQGGLIVAYDTDTSWPPPVGFALAHEAISGGALARAVKRRLAPQRVFALLRHICVARAYQGQGIASRLVEEAYASPTFKDEQIPTAYAFAENKLAAQALTRWGFVLDPPDQEPKEIDFFGVHRPVQQRRWAAPSVATVRANTRQA